MFLVISGFMFGVATKFIDGKQQKAEFRQSLSDTASQFQQIISDIGSGSYASNDNLVCTAAPLSSPSFSSGAKDQGSNKGCVYLGKAIQFDSVPPTGPADGTHFTIYTVAGRQYSSTNNQVLATQFGHLTGADVFQVAMPDSGGTTQSTFKYGSQLTKVLWQTSSGVTVPASCPSTNPGMIGLFGSFGKYNGFGGLVSGAQSVVVTCVPGVSRGQDSAAGKAGIANIVDSSVLPGGVQYLLCFEGNTQKGTITIGGSGGQQLTVSAKVGINPLCP